MEKIVKKIALFVFISVVLFLTGLKGEYFPIIFVHGIEKDATDDAGWKTWGNYSNSAMNRINNGKYKGYYLYTEDCNYQTPLTPTGDTKVMYNFSYRNPDGSRGVIGSNGNEYNAQTKEESPIEKEIKNPSFWRKLSYGLGYSGGYGLSYALGKHYGPFIKPWYWLNSVNMNVSYPLKGDKEVEIGFGYGWWPRLTDRVGLSLYIPNEDPNTGYAYVTTSNWDLSTTLLYLQFHINSSFFIGGCMNYCVASTKEHLNHHSSNIYTKDTTAYVQRKCIGGTLFCGWEGSSMFGTSRLKPYLKLQLGWAREYENDSPWNWEDKLTVGLSGAFLGLKFEMGG